MVPKSIHRRALRLSLAAGLFLAPFASPGPARAANAAAAGDIGALSGPAVLAVVSLRDQRISIYDAQGGALRARVSSGQTDYETPVGVYSILQKNKDHYSNLYDDAQMPFMQRLTWSGIALHAGALPGYPASHGCVRLPYNFAEQLFPLSKIGTRVIVARDDVAPVEIAHPLLFKPTSTGLRAAATRIAYAPDDEQDPAGRPFQPDLRNWPSRQALLEQLRSDAAAKSAEADALAPRADELKKLQKAKAAERAKTAKALRRAEAAKKKADEWAASAALRLAGAKTDNAKKSAEQNAAKAMAAVAKADERLAAAKAQDQAAEAELARATKDFAAAEAARTAAVASAREAKRKTLPVSVFVSLKTQRLYVRQGYEPVLDVPVTISEPENPVGTHVYTAVDYKDDGNDVRWNVVSLRPHPPGDAAPRMDKKRHAAQDTLPPPTDLGAATAALDRIVVPPDVAARVSEYVWPGSSLIVSDEAVSKETGNATDFVVLISGEPQGGIKKRPRQPPPGYYDDRYYDDDYFYDRRRGPRYTPFFSFW